MPADLIASFAAKNAMSEVTRSSFTYTQASVILLELLPNCESFTTEIESILIYAGMSSIGLMISQLTKLKNKVAVRYACAPYGLI